MLFWPTVTLLGFLLVTGFVIAMGANTTARYEREQQRAERPAQGRTAEPVGAIQAA